jgi:hypothetical protein
MVDEANLQAAELRQILRTSPYLGALTRTLLYFNRVCFLVVFVGVLFPIGVPVLLLLLVIDSSRPTG